MFSARFSFSYMLIVILVNCKFLSRYYGHYCVVAFMELSISIFGASYKYINTLSLFLPAIVITTATSKNGFRLIVRVCRSALAGLFRL